MIEPGVDITTRGTGVCGTRFARSLWNLGTGTIKQTLESATLACITPRLSRRPYSRWHRLAPPSAPPSRATSTTSTRVVGENLLYPICGIMMRPTQSYHTRALPADSALWGRLRRKRRRSPGLPDVPTFQEAGIKGLVISQWMGVFVPAGTPAAIVVRPTTSLSYANTSTGCRSGPEEEYRADGL